MSLPERRCHRLKNFNYSSNGAYFITICAFEKQHIFGKIEDGIMLLNRYGKIAYEEIETTNRIRGDKDIKITNWVVMPNHIHFIIEISHDPLFDSYPQSENFAKPTTQSIPTIVRAYKASVTKRIRSECSDDLGHGTTCPYKIWQNGYYDNIIKNDKMYEKVWQYIMSNPTRWEDDCYNE